MKRLFSTAAIIALAASSAMAQTGGKPHGLVVPVNGGTRMAYCSRPLTLTIKVDSVAAAGGSLLAGTGHVTGDEGPSRHRSSDEIMYIISGWGTIALGADTVPVGPGSLAFVPTGVSHRLVAGARTPIEYVFVLGTTAASRFQDAARIGCPGGPAPQVAPRGTTPTPNIAPSGVRAAAFSPGEGERITYCLFPLTITAKVDSESVPGSRLNAAVGALRRGTEVATHRLHDEVVYITHGRGRAFIGSDTTAVEAGSMTFVPRDTRHGFINDSAETLEYVVVFSSSFSRARFVRLAGQPGPYCPEPVTAAAGR